MEVPSVDLYTHHIILNMNEEAQDNLINQLLLTRFNRNMYGENNYTRIIVIDALEIVTGLTNLKKEFNNNPTNLKNVVNDYFVSKILTQLLNFESLDLTIIENQLKTSQNIVKYIEEAKIEQYITAGAFAPLLDNTLTKVKIKNNCGFTSVIKKFKARSDMLFQKIINDFISSRTAFPFIIMTSADNLTTYCGNFKQSIDEIHDYRLIDCKQLSYKR